MLIFEWDPEKARANEEKHQVTFIEAAEVFDDDQGLLCDVVGVEPDPAHYPLHSGTAFDFLIVQSFAVVGQLEGQLVGCGVLKHVEDAVAGTSTIIVPPTTSTPSSGGTPFPVSVQNIFTPALCNRSMHSCVG